jgi:hypothetical protein
MGNGVDHGRASAPYTSARLLPHLMCEPAGNARPRRSSASCSSTNPSLGSVCALHWPCCIVVPSFLPTNFVCFNLMDSVEQ